MKISKRNKLFLTNSTNPCTILKKSSIEHTLTLRITNFKPFHLEEHLKLEGIVYPWTKIQSSPFD